MITASDVNKALLKNVIPTTAALGFKKISPRYFRRLRGQTIERILIQSFSRDSATKLGVSTVSFTVSFSVYFLDECTLPWGIPVDPEGKDEHTFQHASTYLVKTIVQPDVPNPKIWYVDEHGQNLAEVLANLSQEISEHVPAWFDKFVEPSAAISFFSDVPDSYLPDHGTLEFLGGKLYSIHRAKAISALAFRAKTLSVAHEFWKECREYYISIGKHYVLPEIDQYIAQFVKMS